jgi:hypothetical protein
LQDTRLQHSLRQCVYAICVLCSYLFGSLPANQEMADQFDDENSADQSFVPVSAKKDC